MERLEGGVRVGRGEDLLERRVALGVGGQVGRVRSRDRGEKGDKRSYGCQQPAPAPRCRSSSVYDVHLTSREWTDRTKGALDLRRSERTVAVALVIVPPE
jgi:hypothetical protein